jgi:NAD(P)-dependent dehydrogenase (short-subunit alcohol dehydrogenase family)
MVEPVGMTPAAVAVVATELDGRTAVVTGAGAGIGRGIAMALAAAGATVVVNDIHQRDADATAGAINDTGGRAVTIVADLGTVEGPKAVVARALELTGQLDVLVNNAGIAPGVIPLGELKDTAIERVWQVNLRGMIHCCREALVPMRTAGWGRIVNIGSRSWLGAPGHTAYSATKGGVVSFSRSLALEVGQYGITVNVVAPGSITTPALEGMGEAALASIHRRHPAGRFGDVDDIARAVRFLAAPASLTLTGQVLHVCGGRSLFGGSWDERSAGLVHEPGN